MAIMYLVVCVCASGKRKTCGKVNADCGFLFFFLFHRNHQPFFYNNILSSSLSSLSLCIELSRCGYEHVMDWLCGNVLRSCFSLWTTMMTLVIFIIAVKGFSYIFCRCCFCFCHWIAWLSLIYVQNWLDLAIM